MKKLKQIISQIKTDCPENPGELNALLWQLICYSPKMPPRLQQQQLLDGAEKFSLTVTDAYFAKKDLVFNGFKWGNGKHKILITHGWGSKAADFSEIITALKDLQDVEVIAFDAPGNGSSEGDLSNLLLYALAVKAVITAFGEPDIFIGHSLGAMANIAAISNLQLNPLLTISITQLIRLHENFEASMHRAEVSTLAQAAFFESFENIFGVAASHYNLNNLYPQSANLNHLVIYDIDDLISPYNYLEEFLKNNPSVNSQNYFGVGHERVLKSPLVINDLVNAVISNLPG